MPTKLTTDRAAIDQPSTAAEATDSTRFAPAELALQSILDLALVLARQAAREDDARERQAAEGVEASGAWSQGPPCPVRRQET
jgi:hypothetical protein